MIQLFHSKVIVAVLMLCVALFISCPVSAQEEAEEPVYITINQAGQDAAGEAGIITLVSDDSSEHAIEISLDNSTRKVATMSMDICNEDTYLTLAGCDTTDRTGGFLCRTRGSSNGCCSLSLFSMNGFDVIEEGTGPIFILKYTLSEEAPEEACTTLSTANPYATDDGGNAIEVVSSPGEYCYTPATPLCEVSISPETAEVSAGETIQFTAATTGTGCDNPCYDWQVTGTGGGSIDVSGLYTAGTSEGTDLITVTDDCQGEINATAEVIVLEDTDDGSDTCAMEEMYGESSEKTELLRYFRDYVLNQTPEGRVIIRLYYQWSPTIVKAMAGDEDFKETLRSLIEEMLPVLGIKVE